MGGACQVMALAIRESALPLDLRITFPMRTPTRRSRESVEVP